MAVDSTSALFVDPVMTAAGEPRALVKLTRLETLWFNTGTLCNIACGNCYIESSPENDRLEYLSLDDVAGYLDEIEVRELGTTEVGFTGGEPFMNPDILAILRLTLNAGYSVLVLTNAMRPMMRPRIQAGLLDLKREFSGQLTLRVSIDHFDATQHEEKRGPGTWAPMRCFACWAAVLAAVENYACKTDNHSRASSLSIASAVSTEPLNA